MNNDLEKKAVVDTGKSATATKKRKTSGQVKKSSESKKSVHSSGGETSQVKKTSVKTADSTVKAPAKKPTAKTSNKTVKTSAKKPVSQPNDNNVKKSVSQSTQNLQNKQHLVTKTVESKVSAEHEEDKDDFDVASVKTYNEEDFHEDYDNDLDEEYDDDYDNDLDEEYDDDYDNDFNEEYDDDYDDSDDEYDDDYDDSDEEEIINTVNHVKTNDDNYNKKSKKKKRRPILIAVPIVTAVAILTAGIIVSSATLGILDSAKHEAFVATKQSNANLSTPQGKFLEGISVQGVDLGGKTMAQAKEQLSIEEAKLIPSINYTLTCHDKIVYLTEDDFEFVFDTVKILNEAYEYSEYMRKTLIDKGRANLRGSEKKDYTITMKFDDDSIKTVCQEVAKKVDVEMQDAHVTNIDTEKDYLPDMFSFAEGVVGYSVDVDDLVTQISTLKKKNNFNADIVGQMKVIEPKTELEDLLKNLVLISKYETYSGNTWEGNMNMTVAMQSMTGSIIKPGEVFSFNGKTGDSNLPENGYYSAGVIVNGASANGVGGGICQAATTIYNAAIRAGMTVVEREPHTWPSTYVPVGIDSAIDYGSIDMKFRNDTEHEVYLICYMEGATLHAYIYGYKPADFDEIVVSSWFTGASGIGFGAGACRNYYKGGKLVKTEDLPDSFYSNGGGSSYAYDEPLSNYVFERVYTDKQATKIAAKVAEETKNKATKDSDSTDKNTDSEKAKSTDSDKETSDSTATNDLANTTIDNTADEDINFTGGDDIVEDVTVNAVIEDYPEDIDDTGIINDTIYSDDNIFDEPIDDISDDDNIYADDEFDDFE